MVGWVRKRLEKRRSSGSPSDGRTSLWQAVILPFVSILVFFLLLEGTLALLGVKPVPQSEDPFVGFAGDTPLFIQSADGGHMVTAPNKRRFFNDQSFPCVKASRTFRVFCMGGSTTYGHPFKDPTSFAGWLRELLPVADRRKDWEVINCGGISYASYREAHLMEELVKYQPDLFIIYTGHNEFLEDRTYSRLRDMPSVLKKTVPVLSRTRTWQAVSLAADRLRGNGKGESQPRQQLRGEVNAILDRSAGLNRYTRDDTLRENVLRHYRISLERMVVLARSVGARVIFVTPASNLKDCTPFKSEHTGGLDPRSRQRSEELLSRAKKALDRQEWSAALAAADQALAFDPRFAELHYSRGQALFGLRRYSEAEAALFRALDEDVCPLRALTPMLNIVADVARTQGAGLVDWVQLLRSRMQRERGHAILGREYFHDHVHLTIEAYRILAVALIGEMGREGLVQPGSGWNEAAVAEVAKRVEGRLDQRERAQALATIARVFLWAGKMEDAERLGKEALAAGGDAKEVVVDGNTILIRAYLKEGKLDRALPLLYSTLQRAPEAVELRYMLAMALLDNGPHMQLEEAAANLLLVCQQTPYDDAAHQFFALAMAKRNRLRIAYSSLIEAKRLNPENPAVKKALDNFPKLPDLRDSDSAKPGMTLESYPSQAPRRLVRTILDSRGQPVPDGIEVEWHENGRLKRFLDLDRGTPDGVELTWNSDGGLVARVVYQNGKRVDASR